MINHKKSNSQPNKWLKIQMTQYIKWMRMKICGAIILLLFNLLTFLKVKHPDDDINHGNQQQQQQQEIIIIIDVNH